jgi:hypothetical protein
MSDNYLSDKTKSDMSEISKYIDGMTIYDQDYSAICDMLSSMDDSLFLKVMEEMKDGNLSFSDFRRVISTDSIGDLMASSFENQEKLYRKYVDLFDYLSELKIIDSGDRLGFLAGNGTDKIIKDGKLDSTEYMSDNDRKNEISALISKDQAEDPLTEFYKNAVLGNILSSDAGVSASAIDRLLLSAHEYLVPVDFDSISITPSDRDFMAENSIGEDEMRKIKSLAAFYAVRENDLAQ